MIVLRLCWFAAMVDQNSLKRLRKSVFQREARSAASEEVV